MTLRQHAHCTTFNNLHQLPLIYNNAVLLSPHLNSNLSPYVAPTISTNFPHCQCQRIGLVATLAVNFDRFQFNVIEAITVPKTHTINLTTAQPGVLNAPDNLMLVMHLMQNKLAKLRRCVSQLSFGSKKFGPRKLLPRTNFLSKLDHS